MPNPKRWSSTKEPHKESLSPLLFSLFLSDIEAHFREAGLTGLGLGGGLEILLLAFADDIVILAETEIDVQHKLNTLLSYCQLNDLKVNVSKTKVLPFHKSPNLKSLGPFYYGSHRVEMVKEYTYLGITFSSSGKFYRAAKDRISKASQASAAVSQILTRARPNSLFAPTKLLDSVINSLLYGSECWADDYLEELETIPSGFIKKVLGLPWNTPHYLIRLETSRSTLEVEILKRKLNWLGKLMAMPETRIPKKCYRRMLAEVISRDSPSTANWVSRLKKQLDDLGFPDIITKQDGKSLEANKDLILTVLKDKIYTRDIQRARKSSYNDLYCSLIPDTNLLYMDMNVKSLGLKSQCRMADLTEARITWRGSLVILKDSENCPFCDSIEPDSIVHLLVDCPASEHIRRSFSYFEINWNILLAPDTYLKAKKLFKFNISCINLRKSM